MIGIFDSGIGGLTVVRAIMDLLPSHDIVYFGDTARTPYGSKSPETLRRYALQDVAFLREQGADLIVIACNSASSTALETIRENFDLPVFEVITPAVALAVRHSRSGRIGVIGTRATIGSGIYEKIIKENLPEARVHSAACPLLVPLVEEGWLKKPETRMIVKKYLLPLKTRQIDTLILGCTHYPVLYPIIRRKIGKRVHIVDSAMAVAEQIANHFRLRPDNDNERTGKQRFFVSDVTPQFEKIAGTLLKKRLFLEQVRLPG